MMTVLSQASKNFVQHQLRLEALESTLSDQTDLYHVNISLSSPSDTTPIDFYYSEEFVQLVCMAMLGEEAEDSETINDLIGETTNQIAGSAKILSDNAFDIGLPCVLKKELLSPKDGTYNAFSIDDKIMICIAIK
jgi:hypothetical protein